MGSLSKSYASLLVILILFSSMAMISFFTVGLAQSELPNFAISITASVNNYSSTCVFGVNSNSSTLYNAKYDSLEPYQKTGIRAYLYYSNQSSLLTTALSQYVVSANGSTIWRLGVSSIDQAGTVTLTWNTTSIGSMALKDPIFLKEYANMNAVNNYSFNMTSGGDAAFIIIYEPTTIKTPSPSPSPTVPELSWLAILPLFLSIFSIAVILRHRKTPKT
jgi:hypothetical protein